MITLKGAQGLPKNVVLGPDIVDMDGTFADVCLTTLYPTLAERVGQVASRFDDLGLPERQGLMLL